MTIFRLSVRRACWLASLHRKTFAYEPRPDPNAELRRKLHELAAQFPAYGSPMLGFMLEREGWIVNHKRLENVYRQEKLSLRLRRKRSRVRHLREALPVPVRPDDCWSMDFIHDDLASGRHFKCLTMIDHCSKESPAIRVDHSIRGSDVVDTLERLRRAGRKPKAIVIDNGPEFRSKALALWAMLRDVKLHFIEPGKPVQNAFIESFNGRFRAECLGRQYFPTLERARLVVEAWRKEYENVRPHSSLGGKTPKEVAERFRLGEENLARL